MSIKDELDSLVDQLGDERAVEALAYLRHLQAAEVSQGPGIARATERMKPHAVPGHVFFAQPQTDLQSLAAQQGVSPITNFDNLLGDFWPEDETADDFIAARRQWRREGGYA